MADIDWTAFGVVSLVIFLPLLMLFLYLGYRKYLQHQRRKLNDELILRLARDGQNLTPELVDTIRQDEKKKTTPKNAMAEAYNKMCVGAALILGGLVVLLRNRVFAVIMVVCGLFLASQGLALYLATKHGGDDETQADKNCE